MDLLTRAQPTAQGPVALPSMDGTLWEIAISPVWWALRSCGLVLTDAPGAAAEIPAAEPKAGHQHDPVFSIVAR
jgi:hypothetical protein